MMSKYDPWVNMLRTTVAAFAAGVGGADAVTVVPFDSPLGEPDEFSRRIARNTSTPAAGRVPPRAGRRPRRRGRGRSRSSPTTSPLAAWEELGRIESEGPEAFDERVAEVAAAPRPTRSPTGPGR